MRFECSHCRGILEILDCEPGEAVACGHCGSAVAVPESRLAAGAVVGDFVLREELGRGGMGTVYLAHQISLDRDAAVKVLHPEFAADEHYTASFVREARAAAQLNHPSIVQAYAVGEDDGVHYFAMEYVRGSTLKQVLVHSGRMVPERALAIVTAVAEALEFGWTNQQLVHRDLKPDNIMLTATGAVKLADLGLARIGSENTDGTGEVHGTPQYISPEQLLGRPARTSADIYSLGATLYHMLSGDFPFRGNSAVEIAEKHLAESLRPLSEVVPDVPPPLAQIVEVMMAKRPAHRYADAGELLEDLRRAGNGEMPLRQPAPGSQVPVDMEAASELDTDSQPVAAPAAAPPKDAIRLRVAAGPDQSAPAAAEPDAAAPEALGDGPDPEVEPSRGRGRFIAALVFLLAIGGGAAYYFVWMKPGSADSSVAGPGVAGPADDLTRIRQLAANGATAQEIAGELSAYAKDRGFRALDERFWSLAAPVIDEDLVGVREQAKATQLELWRDEQKRREEAAEEARRQAEARSSREAEEAARKEQERKEQERKAAEKAEVAAKQQKLRWQAVDLCRANDYGAAIGLFAAMARSPEHPEEAAWAKSKQQCITAAKKLYERVYNSKEKFAGAKIPSPNPRKKWIVTFVGPKKIEAEMVLRARIVDGERKEDKQSFAVEFAAPEIDQAISYLLIHLKETDQTIDKEQLDREFASFLVSRARFLPYAKELLGKLSGSEAMLAEIEVLAAKAEE